ncbi:hypothetical protein D3C76_1088110 [compost metagenome]
MVPRAFGIQGGRQVIGGEQFDHPRGQLRRARRRVLHAVQLVREAMEVVPGLRLHGAADPQVGRFPVRGDHQDRPWPWQFPGQALERRGAGAGVQGEHGGAVGDEQGGKHG